jgi:hypothetical protein
MAVHWLRAKLWPSICARRTCGSAPCPGHPSALQANAHDGIRDSDPDRPRTNGHSRPQSTTAIDSIFGLAYAELVRVHGEQETS